MGPFRIRSAKRPNVGPHGEPPEAMSITVEYHAHGHGDRRTGDIADDTHVGDRHRCNTGLQADQRK